MAVTAAAPDTTALYEQARAIAQHAHSPYSHKDDGAVVLTDTGHTYTGVNFEGVANRAGLTATQGALANAQMNGDTIVKAVAFARADGSSTGSPPGSDLQAALELMPPEGSIDVIFKHNGAIERHPIAEVIPDYFRPSDVGTVLAGIKAGTMPPTPPVETTRAERNLPSGHIDIQPDGSFDHWALVHLAKDARADTATRSGYGVGAAVLVPNGDVFTGTNIGQTTSRLGTCGETEAAVRARSAGNDTFTAVATAGPEGDYHPVPCGSCREHLTKFDDPNHPMQMLWESAPGQLTVMPLADLLPFHESHEHHTA